MFRLSREVRFAINATPDDQLASPPTNGFGGFPTLTGLGYPFTLTVTLSGEPDAKSHYVRNIKEIDDEVRRIAIPLVSRAIEDRHFAAGGHVMADLAHALKNAWPPCTLDRLTLALSPYQSWTVIPTELPMIRLSQKFEFSASHRLHNPQLSEAENQTLYGKCNNPHGHGHNYELQVTIAGKPDTSGRVIDVRAMERVVKETVLDRFDHKYLNEEVPEFRETIPTVERIAEVIFGKLKPAFDGKLSSVTVWETGKTWCEFSG